MNRKRIESSGAPCRERFQLCGFLGHPDNRLGTVTPTSDEVARLVPSGRWHELLSTSDYIVNALPLTAETLRKFGEYEFRVMKQSGCFINVGRGKTVEESSLVKALKEGWIAAAGLDVCETEPLDPDSELYSLPIKVHSIVESQKCHRIREHSREATSRAI